MLIADISGHTRVYAILADPIAHVRTPQMMNALMQGRGINGVMVPLHVRPDGLAAAMDGLRATANFGGFVATVPHKTRMPALCDAVSPAAAAVGAANMIRREPDGRLVGDIADGTGFVAGLRAAGVEPRGLSAFLAGAGGAAGAIAFALAEAGVSRLTLFNRTPARAEELRARLAQHHPALPVRLGTADPAGHDLAVNGTSLGLHPGDPLPFDVSRLARGSVVAEVVAEPEITPLLTAAAAHGCRVQPGMPMLQQQAELMARFLGMIAA